MLLTSINIKKWPKEQSPNRRKFAQSGHPDQDRLWALTAHDSIIAAESFVFFPPILYLLYFFYRFCFFPANFIFAIFLLSLLFFPPIFAAWLISLSEDKWPNAKVNTRNDKSWKSLQKFSSPSDATKDPRYRMPNSAARLSRTFQNRHFKNSNKFVVQSFL
jgi:hypothetical protein